MYIFHYFDWFIHVQKYFVWPKQNKKKNFKKRLKGMKLETVQFK